MPLCATVVSPFTDLTRTEEQYVKDEDLEKDFLPGMAAVMSSQYYLQGDDPKHPLISPKYGELHSLPPVLIQAGESETLARDSIEFAHRLEIYGGVVQLEMYPDMPHVFPMFASLGIDDAIVAIQRQAKFMKQNLSDRMQNKPRRGRFQVLVHGKRTMSFDNLQEASGRIRKMVSVASLPILARALLGDSPPR